MRFSSRKMFLACVLLLVVVLGCSYGSLPQDGQCGTDLVLLDTFFCQNPFCIEASNDLIFVGCWPSSIYVLQFTQQYGFRLLDRYDWDWDENLCFPYAIHVKGSYAYVAAGDAGLRILDISNPAQIHETAWLPIEGALGIDVLSNQYALIASTLGSLVVVDVRNPMSPEVVAQLPVGGRAWDVCIQGDYAYIAEEWYPVGGIRVVDIRTPSFPSEVGFRLSQGNCRNISVQGPYLYAACSLVVDFDRDGLSVFDVSDPADPREIGFYGVDGHLGDQVWDVAVYSDRACISGRDIRLLDVSIPEHPEEIARFSSPDRHVSNGITVSADIIFSCVYGTGVTAIEQVSRNCPPETTIVSLQVTGTTATLLFEASDDNTLGAHLTYSYRLVRPGPAYDAWSTWSSGKTKEYTDLAPGSYKFQVRAKDADEAIDPSPASKEFAILEPQAAEWVRIRNTPNGIWRLRKDEWTDSGPSDEVLMLLPNQWVLKVVSKTDPQGHAMEDESCIWWRVENPGNGLVGLMAARKKNGSIEYLVPSDPAPAEIIQKVQARASETLSVLSHYYNADDVHQSSYSSTDLYAGNDWGYNSRPEPNERAPNHIAAWINDKYEIPLEFLLAIAVAEIGSHGFNNEVYGTTTGGGIGIMQITGGHLIGYGSNLKCYACSPSAGVSKVYTNSSQGIHANIKDGLRVFQDSVWWAFRKWDPPSAEEIPCLAGAPDNSLRSIAAVWKYNCGGVENYLKHVSDALGSLDDYYGDYRASLEDCGHGSVLDDATLETWQTYFECMDNHKIKAHLGSPGELRVYDTAGRIAGSVDGNPVEEIPGSVYSAAHDTVVIFCPLVGYTYEVHGTDTGLYQLDVARVVAGERVAFVATDIPIVSGGTHQYTVDWDVLARGEDGVTLQIDNDGDGTFEETIQAGSTLDGTTTPIANQPPVIDILAPVSGESSSGSHYQIQWQATDPDTPASSLSIDLFYSTNDGITWTSIATNEANDGVYDWNISALQGGEYWLKLVAGDSAGGTSEATVGPFTIVTLAGNVIVGPNPVTNTGTAFFYTLPDGTSTAKLMILSIAGRLLFETPLNADSTRFPSAGTWNPVDQGGIPLANGPYVYVLIADGKAIGQGKMVIQR